MANAAAHHVAVLSPDKDAAEIGKLYALARSSLVGSLRASIECGQKLSAKKTELKHGEWLPWLQSNSETLGMNVDTTPQRLMRLASDSALTQNLDESNAVTVSRKLWGNKPRGAGDGASATPASTDAKTQLIGALARVADFCGQNEPDAVASSMRPDEVAKLQAHARVIDAWLGKFIGQL
jgi:Protein of unknown function (DUF3102)